MSDEEKNAIRSIMEAHGTKTPAGEYTLEPSICLTVQYLTILKGTLREVSFVSFEFDMEPAACTYEQMVRQSKTLHPKLEFTSLDKVIFEKRSGRKRILLRISLKSVTFCSLFSKTGL